MTNFIVLTEVFYHNEANKLLHRGDVYINPAHIERMKRGGTEAYAWTTIHLAGSGRIITVTEAPEAIRQLIIRTWKEDNAE